MDVRRTLSMVPDVATASSASIMPDAYNVGSLTAPLDIAATASCAVESTFRIMAAWRMALA
jgi:hypothetical protein